MRTIKKILVDQTGKKYFVKDIEDFHTSAGVIKKTDLSKSKVKSSKGVSFTVLKPSFVDLLESIQRGPQVMIQKDIGLILTKTGVNKNSLVVDAGGGSGLLCFSLGNVCKKITVYEINPEHYRILSKNKELLGAKNCELKHASIYKGIKEKNVDLITLDLPEPWQVIEHASGALKIGGYLVIYLPNLSQVKMFIDSTRSSSLQVLETVELLERKWKIEDKIMRPEFQMLGHTGFMVFCRKL